MQKYQQSMKEEYGIVLNFKVGLWKRFYTWHDEMPVDLLLWDDVVLPLLIIGLCEMPRDLA